MEGLFHTEQPAPLTIIGQPNMETLTIDNPIKFPALLSFLTYWRFDAEVRGLTSFPRDQWPDLVPLVYYAYHIMIILGVLFIAITFAAVFLLWRGRLWDSRWMLWIVMLATPFPYIATTAGWITTEVGRQPWLVYGLYATAEGLSPMVSSGNVLFTYLGFLGLYLLLGIAYIVLVFGLLGRGPRLDEEVPERSQAPPTPIGADSDVPSNEWEGS
jgi:cytochrome d ubiquinol oxidase subunit I